MKKQQTKTVITKIDDCFYDMKKRMKLLKITQYNLAVLIDVNESTLIRNFKGETEMSLSTYFKICDVLNKRPT